MNRVVLLVAAALAGFVAIMWLSPSTYALDCSNPATAAEQTQCAINTAETGDPSSGETDKTTIYTTIGTIINTLLFIVGILSVVMIIYGGIQYVTSAGANDKTKKARNTIVYSIVGLVVSILAFALVSWVIDSLD